MIWRKPLAFKPGLNMGHEKWLSTCRDTAISSPSKSPQIGQFADAVRKVASFACGWVTGSSSSDFGKKSASVRGGSASVSALLDDRFSDALVTGCEGPDDDVAKCTVLFISTIL